MSIISLTVSLAFRVQERYVHHREEFRWCVIDQNNDVVVHSAHKIVADEYAAKLNAYYMRERGSDAVDAQAARAI